MGGDTLLIGGTFVKQNNTKHTQGKSCFVVCRSERFILPFHPF